MTDQERVATIKRAMLLVDHSLDTEGFDIKLVTFSAEMRWLCDQLEAAWNREQKLLALIDIIQATIDRAKAP